MQGWFLSMRDLAWAWWPLPLCSSCFGQWSQELYITSVFPLWPIVLWLGKCLGLFLVEPLLGLLHSFLLPELPWVCLLHAGNISFPSLGRHLVSPRASCTPQGRRSFNTIFGGALGVLGPVGTTGSFCFRVVCGEGIASSGCLVPPPPSFLRCPPVGPLSHIWALLIIHGPCCPPLQTSFLAPNFSLHSL